MKKKSRFLSVFLAIMFLSGQVFAGNISGNVTGDQKDALDGANSPSSTNVVATMDDVASLDTGVQTASGGVNITNSGTAKNPIFDLDISEDVNMNTDYQLINLQAPAASGEAIRQTTKITEAILEALYDNRATTYTSPLSLTAQTVAMTNVNNTNTDGYLTWEQYKALDDAVGLDTTIFALIATGRPFTGNQDFEDGIKVDTILESTVDAGVTIESVRLENGEVQAGTWAATAIGMSVGGTGANLSNDPGGIPYCAGSVLAILADGTAGKFLQSGGTSAPVWEKVDLASGSDITGTLAVGNGGTGLTSLTAHKLIVGNDASAPNLIDVGTNGQMLLGQNTADPSWQTMDTDATMDETGTVTIAAEAVTYAKMQHISNTARLLGRSTAGAGDVEEITVGGDISQSGSTFTIGSDKVSYDKMQDVSATDLILGRSSSGAGTVEEIACTATGRAILAANALTRYLHWSPAYNGYALSADGGSNDAGDSGIIVGFAGTLGDSDNTDTPYIEWSSTESGVSDYDVIIKIPIPADYSSMTTFRVEYDSDTVQEDTATVYLYDSNDDADSSVVLSSSTWAVDETMQPSGTYTAGEHMTIKLHLEAAEGQSMRIGEIRIPYVATR